MRIDGTNSLTPVSKDATPAKEAAPAAPRTRTRPDVVHLSTAAAAANDVRPADVTARLSRISQQIAKGTYPIDLDKLASRISEEDLK